jgi:transposase
MNKLEDVDADTLRETLAETTDPKAVKRLMVALAYDDGVPVDTLSERYGIARSTVYSWLDRFEESSVPDAVRDEPRPGRPARLDEAERERLAAALRRRPTEFGFENASWTPELLREHVRREFGVVYSLGHVRRLLRRSHDSD